MNNFYKLSLVLILININILANSNGGYGYGSRWITAEPGLIMRDTPNLKAEKICTIPYGEKVIILDEKTEVLTIAGAKGRWTEVDWNGKTGWVFGGFLTEENMNQISLTEDFLYGDWRDDDSGEIMTFNHDMVYEDKAAGIQGEWYLEENIIYINYTINGVEVSYSLEVLEYDEDYMLVFGLDKYGDKSEYELFKLQNH